MGIYKNATRFTVPGISADLSFLQPLALRLLPLLSRAHSCGWCSRITILIIYLFIVQFFLPPGSVLYFILLTICSQISKHTNSTSVVFTGESQIQTSRLGVKRAGWPFEQHHKHRRVRAGNDIVGGQDCILSRRLLVSFPYLRSFNEVFLCDGWYVLSCMMSSRLISQVS